MAVNIPRYSQICHLQSHWIYLFASPSECERQARVPEWGGGALPLGCREQPRESIPPHAAECRNCITAAGGDEFLLGYHLSAPSQRIRELFSSSLFGST